MPSSIKIPIAILGATGSVGQKFIEILSTHPWFEVTELAASEKSAGKKYKDAVDWFMPPVYRKRSVRLKYKNVNQT